MPSRSHCKEAVKMESQHLQSADPPIDIEAEDADLPQDKDFQCRLLIGPMQVVDPHIRRLQDGMTVEVTIVIPRAY